MADVQEILNKAVPIVELGRPDQDFPYPAVRVDAARRPDIHDLPRLLEQEGASRVSTTTMASHAEGTDWIILTIEAQVPARYVFHLAFDYWRDREFLEDVARCGGLFLVAEPRPEANHAPTEAGMLLTIDRSFAALLQRVSGSK